MKALWIAGYGPGLYQYAVRVGKGFGYLVTGTKPQCTGYARQYGAMQRAERGMKAGRNV